MTVPLGRGLRPRGRTGDRVFKRRAHARETRRPTAPSGPVALAILTHGPNQRGAECSPRPHGTRDIGAMRRKSWEIPPGSRKQLISVRLFSISATWLERWPSGRRRSPAKGVYRKRYRGFESLPLRHNQTSRCRPSIFTPARASHMLGRPLALRTPWVRNVSAMFRHNLTAGNRARSRQAGRRKRRRNRPCGRR